MPGRPNLRNRKARAYAGQGGLCWYCGRAMLPPGKPPLRAATPDLSPTWDHRVPTSRGGGGWPDNLVLACRGCNQDKGDRTEGEYLAQSGRRTSPDDTKGVAA